MEDLARAGAEAPAPSSAPETQIEAPNTEAPESSEASLDAELAKVFAKATREPAPRAQDGKFASKNPAPAVEETPAETAATEVDQTQEAKPVEAQKPAPIDGPQSWSAEMKAKFGTLPPDVQQYVVQRDKETHEHISRLGNAVANFRPIGEVLKQHEATFRSKNISYVDGIAELLTAQKMLDQNPAAAIAQIATSYGVDLARLVGEGNPQNAALMQQVQALTSELTALKQNLGQSKAQEEAQKRGTLEASIVKFSADKPDFDELADDIAMAASAIRAANPNAAIEDVLTQAYEKARWANPKTRAKLLEQQVKDAEQKRIEDAKKAADNAKKAASVNVKSQPKANANDDDLDAQLVGVWNKTRAA